MEKWHQMDADSVFGTLGTRVGGLTEDEAKQRLRRYGRNVLVRKKGRAGIAIFVEQFKSVLILILLFAVAVSLATESYTDAAVIAAILLINGLLGFRQEYKAELAIESLEKYLVAKVRVIRSRLQREVDAETLVPGDMVILEAGERVPADIRLTTAANLRIDEASFTGESVPVTKTVEPIEDRPVSERRNMAYLGTLAVSGRALGVVVATGMSTEFGRLAASVQEREEPTPLQLRLTRFGKWLGLLVVVVAGLILAIGLLKGEPLVTMLLTALSLAISAVPEGLPAVVTVTLAIGAQRMVSRNALIRRLGAVEALGSTDVICADKTGTMTTNEMTVRKIFVGGRLIEVGGVGFDSRGGFYFEERILSPRDHPELMQMLRIAKMCNDAALSEGVTMGDPTEVALLILAAKGQLEEEYVRLAEIPFSSERKMMTTIHPVEDRIVAYSKGAPETLVSRCTHDMMGEELNERRRREILDTTTRLASEGLRVLAFAYRPLAGSYDLQKVEGDMVFVGLAALMDPPRKETREAVKLCQRAGVRVVMLTGDHIVTAEAVAREVGIPGTAVAGVEVERMDDAALEALLNRISIFARVSPEHKLRIVQVLKRKGLTVAVTGDGVNDAPALKRADVGVAMGIKGTDVAKDASDMILVDDNFASIVAAVEEGRHIFANIKKFLRFLLSANFDEITVVAAAGLMALPLPFLPLQILWINLVTDGLPALALTVDPKERELMDRKPSRDLLRNSLFFLGVAAGLASASTLGVFVLTLPRGVDQARTMAFTTTMLFELLLVFNVRSETRSVFRSNPFTNKRLVLAVLSSLLLQLLVVYAPPLQGMFRTVALDPTDWLLVFAFASPALLVLPELFMKKD